MHIMQKNLSKVVSWEKYNALAVNTKHFHKIDINVLFYLIGTKVYSTTNFKIQAANFVKNKQI